MPTQEAVRTIKVRALKTVYYGEIRYRGDDDLGDGKGQVFELYDREMYKINPLTSRPELDRKTGKPFMIPLTAEMQFSPINMERVDDETPVSDEYISNQDVVTEKSRELVAEQVRNRKK